MSTDRPTLCGDCRSPLQPESTAPKTPAAGDPDCYCPHCRRSPGNTVTCRRCGSLVCGACGSIVERATDLGFG